MIKLLREYNQWILAVGGTLLLIAFLMPSTLQGMAARSASENKVFATYSAGSITGGDIDNARQELRVIETMSPQRFGRRLLSALGADKSADHWILLTQLAADSGLIGGLAEGRAEVAASAANPGAGVTPMSTEQMLRLIAGTTGTTDEIVLTALTKLRGIERMAGMTVAIDRISDRRLKNSVAQALLSVSGNMLVLDARSNSGIEVMAKPTDAQLEEHMRAHADKMRPAANMIGAENFGYRLPDRFKAEWMTISKADVAATVANSEELSTIALKKRFAQNPAKFGAGTGDAANFSAFESIVRTSVTDELVKARMDEIAKFATDQLAIAQRSLKRDGSYFTLPADWASQMPSFESIAQSIASEFGIPMPSYQSGGDGWMTAAEFAALPGVGASRTERFGTATSVSVLLAAAKELSNPNPSTPMQVNIAGPALSGVSGDIHFVRLLDARASEAPADLASVRSEVESDLMALERFRWLEANLTQLANDAAASGMQPLADRFGTKVETATGIVEANQSFLAFGKLGGGLPQLDNDPAAIAAVVEAVSKIPYSADMSSLPAGERTVAVAIPGKLCAIVLEVTAMTPLTEERFATLAQGIMTPNGAGIVNIARDRDEQIDPTILFGFDALKSRYDYESLVAADDALTDASGS
jgi:hypothetical protein